MTTTTTCLSFGDSTLWAVPSIHFRLAFAEEVNRLASQHRPDAIAVELGPETAAASRQWMEERKIGPDCRSRTKLPCMLGLTKPNLRIHPDRREEAMRIQQLTGRELHDLPPEILKELLGFSGVSVLYLSPTDSIIEAVRCSLELDVPLYGVDLEETADAVRRSLLLQPPDSSLGRPFSIEHYTARNVRFAEYQRDESIDHRRETAMAARLKWLLQSHRRVLFICGLAHWSRLEILLASSELRPAKCHSAREASTDGFQRVVVHPLLAIHHLDTIPALAEMYERDRPHAAEVTTFAPRLDLRRVFAEKLSIAYCRHFSSQQNDTGPTDGKLNDFEARHDFEQLLQNLCVIRQRTVPDLFAALVTAQGVMSERFCRILSDVLMEFPWTEPQLHPNTKILAPAPTDPGSETRAEFIDDDGNRSPYFFVQARPGRSGVGVHIRVPWKWAVEPPPRSGKGGDFSGKRSSWIPTGDLMSALMLHAMRLARDHSERPKTELFEGSLYDGVDTKATMRAVTRGDERIYVRVSPLRRQLATQRNSDDDFFPYIWLFQPEVAKEKLTWITSSDSLIGDLRPFVAAPLALDAAHNEFGHSLISAVLATSSPVEDRELTIPGCRVQRQDIYAQLNFNPTPGIKRTAEWAEKTKYQRSPIANGSNLSVLKTMYQERHQVDLNQTNWAASLILMAIPYAQHAVTVAAPDGFTLPRIVYQAAAAKQIEIRFIPLSLFPATAIRKISQLYWIPTLGRTQDDKDLPIYPEHVLRHFDQDVEVYRHLVPKSWY